MYFHIVWPNNVILNVTFGMNFIPCNDFEWQNIWIKKTTPESIQISCNFFSFAFLIVSEYLSLKIDISQKCRKHQEQQTMCYCGITNWNMSDWFAMNNFFHLIWTYYYPSWKAPPDPSQLLLNLLMIKFSFMSAYYTWISDADKLNVIHTQSVWIRSSWAYGIFRIKHMYPLEMCRMVRNNEN